MGSYDESYDYETLTENTANIRKLKNSDEQDKSFFANIAISGLENDKIRKTYGAEEFDIHATKSTRDVEDTEPDGSNKIPEQEDAYSIKNFSAYLNAIETYIENAKSKVWWNPIYHKLISGLLDDFRRLKRYEWSEFEHRKVIGNTLTYLAEAQVRRVTLLEQYELKARQTIDSMVNGLTFKELAEKVGSALTPRLLQKIGHKAMRLFSKNKPTAFGEKMGIIKDDTLNQLSDEDEEDEFFDTLRKYDVDETPEKSEGTTEALGLLASTLRPGTSCEKDYNMMSSLNKKFTEDYYDESSSSSNAADFDKLEFRKDTTSNKLLQRMLALLFVFAQESLINDQAILKVFTAYGEEEKKIFSDKNYIWNKSELKFGGDGGQPISHYENSIPAIKPKESKDEQPQNPENPVTEVYKKFETQIFTSSFNGLSREASKTFFKDFCGNISSSNMQEVYTRLMEPELRYHNIAKFFGDRFKTRDNGKQK